MLVKWAGGKKWMIPLLSTLFKASGKSMIVEPFGGGGAFSFHMDLQHTHLNDVNDQLINLYRHVRNGTMGTIPFEWKNDEEHYYSIRDLYNQSGLHDSLHAWMFLYLNKFGFNGLYRVNRFGKFNVPWGGPRRNPQIPDLASINRRILTWHLTSYSFESLHTSSMDFIYCDPPYEGGFSGYHRDGWSFGDFAGLLGWAALQPGTVVVSNRATDQVMAFIKACDYPYLILETPYTIGGSHGRREKAKEVLILRKQDVKEWTTSMFSNLPFVLSHKGIAQEGS